MFILPLFREGFKCLDLLWSTLFMTKDTICKNICQMIVSLSIFVIGRNKGATLGGDQQVKMFFCSRGGGEIKMCRLRTIVTITIN